ncbi:MAG: lipoyl(octanoyl) transferase LipB [Clostridia bacterium]|nr:lipoyl(octanoyl) transferase LipB [Clostridia bacterium]NCC77177.1 lipoyl(octanoyl) transferase LipB [Clostridia bacterium]
MDKKLLVFDLEQMPYGDALTLQRYFLGRRQQNLIEDTLLLVQHPAVLTLGTRGDYANIYLPKEKLAEQGVAIYEVERGGDVTYHGPGQIVGYPIIALQDFPGSIRGYITAIATALIELLRDEFGIVAEQRFDKYSGVWVGENKIVAIGVAVKRGVTMHGFAFNVNTNLAHFDWINPCGLSKGVTSVERETGQPADLARVKDLVVQYLCRQFDRQPDARPLDERIIQLAKSTEVTP